MVNIRVPYLFKLNLTFLHLVRGYSGVLTSTPFYCVGNTPSELDFIVKTRLDTGENIEIEIPRKSLEKSLFKNIF